MRCRRIPITLVLCLCVASSAWSQQAGRSAAASGRADLTRTPPVAVRFDDGGAMHNDPAPAPTAILASHSVPRPAQTGTLHPVTGRQASIMDPDCPPCNELACHQCGGVDQNCRCAKHICPPARWNVLGRMAYRWNTQTKPALQASHWGYPEEFCERPFGSFTRANLCGQMRNGLEDQLILYRYDFVDESLPEAYQLKPRGRYELAKIIGLLQEPNLVQCGLPPIYIEETVGQPQLNEARRQHVLQQFELMEFPVPAEHVVVGRANAPGISGDESLQIYMNLMRQWQMGGQGAGSGMNQGRTTPGAGAGPGIGSSGLGTSGR